LVEGLGHQVAVVVEKAPAAVELDGRIAVGYLEVKEFGVVLARCGLGEIEKLRSNSFSAMGSLDEEFVNPCAFAAIFEAVVKTDHQVADRRILFADEIGDAVNRIFKKLGETGPDRAFVKLFRPGVIRLHVAHHQKQQFEICQSGTGASEGHEKQCHLCKKVELATRIILRRGRSLDRE